MARTVLNTPTRDELIAMNKLTKEGEGKVFEEENFEALVTLEDGAFDYYIRNINDPTSVGMVFAHLIGTGNIFTNGNKSTATLAFKWILIHNGKDLDPELTEKDLKEIINSTVEVENPADAVHAAIKAVAPFVRDLDL